MTPRAAITRRRRLCAACALCCVVVATIPCADGFTTPALAPSSRTALRRSDSPANVRPGGGAPRLEVAESEAIEDVDAVAPGGGGDGKRRASEYELNLGRAIDVLRQSIPVFLEEEPAWDIYTDGLETRDPAGVALRGLASYQRFHGFLRRMRQLLCGPGFEGASIKSRLSYDWAGQRIRVQWYSRWRARGADPLDSRALHVDGVSLFELNDSGRVYRHTIERVLINGVSAEPPYFGLFNLGSPLAGLLDPVYGGGVAAPSGARACRGDGGRRRVPTTQR